MKLMIAMAVTAAVMCSFSVPARAADPAQCAATCKAYCSKNYPGVAACQDRCQTRRCSRWCIGRRPRGDKSFL